MPHNVEKVIPVLKHEYCSIVFEEISSALSDNVTASSLEDIYSRISEFDRDTEKLKALIFLDKYENLREELFYRILPTYPVIRDKIMQLYEMRHDPCHHGLPESNDGS